MKKENLVSKINDTLYHAHNNLSIKARNELRKYLHFNLMNELHNELWDILRKYLHFNLWVDLNDMCNNIWYDL